MGPFDHPPVPQCRARLPRRSRDGGGRQQRAYLGPGGLHAAARGDSEGAPSVMGLRARAIVLSAAAAESLLRLERSPDPASGSIARRVRSLRSILLADCLHGEVVKQDRIPKALKDKYGLENLFVENLDDVLSEIEGRLDEKDEVRELTIKSSRTIARLSGSAIQAMHRGHDVGTALQETREEILKLRSLLKDHPDLYHTGIVENAMQEAGEAFLVHAILEQDPLPRPKELGLTDTAYLLGLGDVVGELRRFALEHLRRGDVKLASAYLEKMERILDSLMRFDYPTALVALKRKQDVARSLIEKTRGKAAVATRSQELADKLDAHREKLGSAPGRPTRR